MVVKEDILSGRFDVEYNLYEKWRRSQNLYKSVCCQTEENISGRLDVVCFGAQTNLYEKWRRSQNLYKSVCCQMEENRDLDENDENEQK